TQMRSSKPLVILLAIAVLGIPTTPVADPQPFNSETALVASKFQTDVNQFIEAELKLYPERATELGDHRFDHQVNDESAAGVARIVLHAKHWAKIFRGFDGNSLPPSSEADREWLLANIDGELLRTESLRSYERDPGMYLPTHAVYDLIKRNFA